MKVTVNVTGGRKYDVLIKEDFSALREHIPAARRCFIMSDDIVADIYLKDVAAITGTSHEDVFIFPAGEISKNADTVGACYKKLFDRGHDRDSVFIALGGGVTGDLGGFAASTYMRGLELIQIPTSLLSMVDSSVGGKTGYDLDGAKNIVGTFYQPSLVYTSISCLKTLPDREFSDGICECVKHGLIKDKTYFNFISENKESIKSKEFESLIRLVARSVEIKAEVVSEDEKEEGIRAILNFGHTIGHAIEAASGYSLSHGQAVSVGISAALGISGLSSDEQDNINTLLASYDLPLKYKGNTIEIYEFLKKDKKFRSGNLTFISLREIGSAERIKIKDPEILLRLIDRVLL